MEENGWLKAAKILRADPDGQVLCPDCKKGFLHAKDEIWPNGEKCDRYLICDNCKAYNVITFNLDKP